MTKHKATIKRLQRELDKRTPAEPLVIKFYYTDDWPDGDSELAYEVVVDNVQYIQLKWPEDE